MKGTRYGNDGNVRRDKSKKQEAIDAGIMDAAQPLCQQGLFETIQVFWRKYLLMVLRSDILSYSQGEVDISNFFRVIVYFYEKQLPGVDINSH